MNQKLKIVWCIPRSYGNVDWLMPMIYTIKKKIPQSTVHVIFQEEDLEKFFAGAFALRKIFFENVDEITTLKKASPRKPSAFRRKVILFLMSVLPEKIWPLLQWMNLHFGPFKLSKNYHHADYYFFGHTTGAHTTFTKIFNLIIKLNHAKSVLYPPTTDLYFYLKHGVFEKWLHEQDYIFANSIDMAAHFSPPSTSKKIISIPRYDFEWIQALVQEHEQLPAAKELKNFLHGKNVVLYLIRGPGGTQMSEDRFEYLLNSAMDVFTKKPNTVVIIKPHPRQDLAELNNKLKGYKEKYVISNLHTFFLSSLSNVVVSQAVSAAFDALYCKVPVIEYFIFDTDTNYTADWREQGFVFAANNPEELESQMDLLSNKTDLSGLHSFMKFTGIEGKDEIKKALTAIDIKI